MGIIVNKCANVNRSSEPKFPFIWKWPDGYIYIRYTKGRDFCLEGSTPGPCEVNVTDASAWSWRLPLAEGIVISNDY